MKPSNEAVRGFWERNPVAAAAISVPPGAPDYFKQFDRLREAPDCEPLHVGERVHRYTSSSNKRVLDIGCGNGYVLSRYARAGAEVHGLDLTQRAVDLAMARFALSGLQGTFHLTDGERVPYPNDCFDVVCSMGVLHHVVNPQPMIEEMFRVLKPGGEINLMLYHRHSFHNLVRIPLMKLLHPRYQHRTLQDIRNLTDGDGCPWAAVYSRGEARALLSKFNGHEFAVNQISWPILLGKRNPLTGVMKRLLPDLSRTVLASRLGWNLYIRAYKPV